MQLMSKYGFMVYYYFVVLIYFLKDVPLVQLFFLLRACQESNFFVQFYGYFVFFTDFNLIAV